MLRYSKHLFSSSFRFYKSSFIFSTSRVFVRYYNEENSSSIKESSGNTYKENFWVTVSSESNSIVDAIENCITQLKRQRIRDLPDDPSVIVIATGNQCRSREKHCSIPKILEEKGICPASRVFGGMHFHQILTIPNNTMSNSISITVAQMKGVTFTQKHIPKHDSIELDFAGNEFEDSSDLDLNSVLLNNNDDSNDDNEDDNKDDNKDDNEDDEDNEDDSEEYFEDSETNVEYPSDLDPVQLDEEDISDQPKSYAMILADGYHVDETTLLSRLNLLQPNLINFGVVSFPRDNSFFYVGGELFCGGCSILQMTGDINIDFVSTKGYTPLGIPFDVTETNNQEIITLDGVNVTDAIDKRLESYGYNPQETYVLYKIISKVEVGKEESNLVTNPTLLLSQFDFIVDEPVHVEDKLQIYAFDYKTIIGKLGDKISQDSYSNNISKRAIFAFSSLLNTHHLRHKRSSYTGNKPALMFVDNPKFSINTSQFQVHEMQNFQTLDDSNAITIHDDNDLTPHQDDIKQEVYRLVKHYFKFPYFAGVGGNRTLIPLKNGETVSSAASICFAIIHTK